MDGEILIPISMFLATFGVIYLYLSTRNRERLALIEKGADAKIFMKGNTKSSFGKVFILNLAVLLMGIGLGVFLALILDTYTTMDSDGIYPACIFFMAGVGLFVGFTLTKQLEKE
ncbi:hypothetical protein OD91_2414 [Lutibacter sp. Hel_I_33_5]|uniref:DUF6249 domain-containing protein n=1 Tax=Lutibacter sp. Hel_I_33_5 TaxID=1566289 RepID=UPI0011A45CDF|nr:DUF6249 domain-containing protein [Lutibacter sp. Hel_I_33_5]TVZ57108.1 hypothetical protein OD91_2414 [Lutibacter sp. Hel_I_33_5]